ncbi:MAG TPA: hypothetical protein VLB51_17820 [Methylomirabilota bacterium]|nr:hypothetical protein [Methylomirabilota bacterium]
MEARSLDEVCEQLSREIAAELESRPGRRWRCPVLLRSRIVSYARVCREQGEPLHQISSRLGLVESTLARWLKADRRALALAPGFRSVSVAVGDAHVHDEAGGALRLTTPAGYMVEGLDAQTLAFLLRVVG